jgi:hypothetical protein
MFLAWEMVDYMPTITAFFSRVFLVLLLLGLLEVGFKVSVASAAEVGSVPVLPDLNGDGVVDISDVAIPARAYGSHTGDPNWNSAADLNYDGVVNMDDVAFIVKDFWKKCRVYDFDEPSGWSVSGGNWSVQNGALEGFSNYEGLIYAGNATLGDCTFTAKLKIAADSPQAEAAICVYLDPGNYYWAGLGCWGHSISISRMVNYVPEELIFSGNRTDIVKDVWHTVSVKVSNGTIMLSVDDSLELDVDDSTFESGLVGIRTWSSHVIVDYVTVIGRTLPPYHAPVPDVLYADGTKLLSPSGQEVSLVGTQIDYNVLNRDVWFNMDDVQKIKSYGGVVLEFNGLLFKDMMPQRGVIDQNWIDRLDKWVSWCEQTQMYCIINFGNFEYKPWGPEAPSWLLEGKYSLPWTNDTWNQASIDFWDVDNPLQEDNRQAVLTGFQFIASRYKNDKCVLFGLFNEPFCLNYLVNQGNAEHLSITYARFVERIVDTIRSTGARQLIFVDKPYCWFNTSHFEPVNRDGIVWEDHLYVSAFFDVGQWKSMLNEFVQTYYYDFQKPFYVGEYGFINYTDNMISDSFLNWKQVLQEEVNFLKALPVCGYSWHEYPWLYGEYYYYDRHNTFSADESDYILRTICG